MFHSTPPLNHAFLTARLLNLITSLYRADSFPSSYPTIPTVFLRTPEERLLSKTGFPIRRLHILFPSLPSYNYFTADMDTHFFSFRIPHRSRLSHPAGISENSVKCVLPKDPVRRIPLPVLLL